MPLTEAPPAAHIRRHIIHRELTEEAKEVAVCMHMGGLTKEVAVCMRMGGLTKEVAVCMRMGGLTKEVAVCMHMGGQAV